MVICDQNMGHKLSPLTALICLFPQNPCGQVCSRALCSHQSVVVSCQAWNAAACYQP